MSLKDYQIEPGQIVSITSGRFPGHGRVLAVDSRRLVLMMETGRFAGQEFTHRWADRGTVHDWSAEPVGVDELLEQLAAVEHERWAHWQTYMHSQCERGPDGSLTIPAALVERWERQAATLYADLSDREKESDREQVRRYLPLVRGR